MFGIKSIARRIVNRTIISTDLIGANISYTWQCMNCIATPEYRLGDPIWNRELQGHLSDNKIVHICIFVVYSTEASLSTISYIKAIHDAGFAILVINNSVTSTDHIEELKPICWRIYNRKNIGRDIGAFKDGVMYLFTQGILQKCRFLCLANDSMQFVPGVNGADFTQKIKEFISTESGALFTHQSHQIVKHYQSFFQLVDNEVINSQGFYDFWSMYRPLTHREHCIHKGEIALSQSVYNKLKDVRVLYTVDSLLASIRLAHPEAQPSMADILGIMPSQSRTKQNGQNLYGLEQLTEAAQKQKYIDPLLEHYLAELIENSNPTHVAAFLYPMYLKCPLIKHDLCFAGSFGMGKALALFDNVLRLAGLEDHDIDLRHQEFRRLIWAKGIPSDYKSKPLERALKGVTQGFIYTPS